MGYIIFVKVRLQNDKIWLSTEWIEKNIVEKCKNTISSIPIIDNEVGTRVALLDEWRKPNIWIVHDTDADVRREIWRLFSQLAPDMVTNESEIDEWYYSLWSGCNKFTLQNLLQYVQELENLDALEEKVGKKGEEWLNQLYTLIAKKKSAVDYIRNNQVSIFPNQNGYFCSLDKLLVDLSIDDEYKEILNYLQNDCKNELLDKKIIVLDWMHLSEFSMQDVFVKIKSGILQSPEQKENVYSQLILLYTKENEISNLRKKQIEFLQFAKVIFAEKYTVDYKVSIISEDLLEESIKYLCGKTVDEISQYKNLRALDLIVSASEESVEKWIARFIDFIRKAGYSFLLDRKENTILPNQNGEFRAKEELFADNGEMGDILKNITMLAGYDIKNELLLTEVFLPLPDNRTKGIADIAPYIISYVKNNQGFAKTQDMAVMDVLKKLYHWVKDNQEMAMKYFKEIHENIHWLYNDEEIAENMKKAEQVDSILEKYHIDNISVLEDAFIKMSEMENVNKAAVFYERESEEEILIQYGIASEEQYKEAINMRIFNENFIYSSSHDTSKLVYVNQILERAKKNIIDFLRKKPEYDLSNIIEINKTIFIIEKNNEQIYLITRPSDYDYVAIYYDSERNVLDYNKEWELWVEDGKKEPEKLTFGKILKLTGINKIPLKKVEG